MTRVINFPLEMHHSLALFTCLLAEVYGDGESEKEIKRFQEKYSEEEKAKQVIATKYFPHAHRTQFPDVLLSALKDSLSRLGSFKVDLYQIHAPIHPVEIEVVGK